MNIKELDGITQLDKRGTISIHLGFGIISSIDNYQIDDMIHFYNGDNLVCSFEKSCKLVNSYLHCYKVVNEVV